MLDIGNTLTEACFERPPEPAPELHSPIRTKLQIAFLINRKILGKVEDAVLHWPRGTLAIVMAAVAVAAAVACRGRIFKPSS